VQLDVHVRPSAESFVVPRNGAGLDELVARLQAIASAVIAVEATGGFECVVTAALAGAGLPVVVVNPAQVRAFANALGKRAKTDPIDAAVIAHFVARRQSRTCGLCPMRQHSSSPISSPGAARSSR
jgi:transposase